MWKHVSRADYYSVLICPGLAQRLFNSSIMIALCSLLIKYDCGVLLTVNI